MKLSPAPYLIVFVSVAAALFMEPAHESRAAGPTTPALARLRVPAIAWRSQFQAALQEARRLKKPLMVDFRAKWCGPCHGMDEHTFNQVEVIRESRNWIPVMVDIDPGTAARYLLQMPPVVMFLRPDGSEIDNLAGYATAPAMVKLMKASLARLRQNDSRHIAK